MKRLAVDCREFPLPLGVVVLLDGCLAVVIMVVLTEVVFTLGAEVVF